MNSEKWQKIKAIFNEAVELSPAEAEAFLRSQNGAGDEILEEARKLLAAEKQNRFEKPIAVVSNLITDAADVRIFDLSGRVIERGQARVNAEMLIGGKLAPGAYFIEVRHGDLSKKIKVIKL